jgi:hypothetical protein
MIALLKAANYIKNGSYMKKCLVVLFVLASVNIFAQETKSSCGKFGYFRISSTKKSYVSVNGVKFDNLTAEQVKLVLSVAAAYPVSFCISQKPDGELSINN